VKKSVYIETTIVSYLTARPSRDVIRTARQAITRQWWDNRREDFDLLVSQVVFNEAKKGDQHAAERRKHIIEGMTRLDISDEAVELAATLVEEGAMPPKAADDALHLANAETMIAVASVLTAAGYPVPIVCTPDELMGG
jgi:hypothetical protein